MNTWLDDYKILLSGEQETWAVGIREAGRAEWLDDLDGLALRWARVHGH